MNSADTPTRASVDRSVGTIGLACSAAVVVILGVHPLGTAELCSDGAKFVNHIGGWWLLIHIAAVPAPALGGGRRWYRLPGWRWVRCT